MATSNPTINAGGIERPMTDEELAAYQQTTADLVAHQSTDVDAVRRSAYERTADPIFFRWQRGDATEQEWLDAVAAVKAEYPDPPEQ